MAIYGMANEKTSVAARFYAERFSNRERYPSDKTIAAYIRRARKTGVLLVNHQHDGAAVVRRNIRDEETILRAFEDNPGNSVHRVLHIYREPRIAFYERMG